MQSTPVRLPAQDNEMPDLEELPKNTVNGQASRIYYCENDWCTFNIEIKESQNFIEKNNRLLQFDVRSL